MRKMRPNQVGGERESSPADQNRTGAHAVLFLFTAGFCIIHRFLLRAQGFNYPPEAGYALNPYSGPHYFMLETHYTNPQLDAFISDSSGLRLLYTNRLRAHDAGILSIGIDPNWRHIIPPGQPEVVSEGHCIADCTGQTIPNSGINMFAVIMHTHQLGRKVRLRQIRAGEELPPIAADTNYDPNYQEYRRLQRPAKVYPVSLARDCVYCKIARNYVMRNIKCKVYKDRRDREIPRSLVRIFIFRLNSKRGSSFEEGISDVAGSRFNFHRYCHIEDSEFYRPVILTEISFSLLATINANCAISPITEGESPGILILICKGRDGAPSAGIFPPK
jgi:hypothetical protein